jgi:hypothetical protein
MSFTHSEQLNELGAALAKAQAIMATAKKDSQNPFFRSSYADLASVWEACREPLTQNGLSVAQFPGFEPGNPPTALVTTILLHTSGQWMAETAGAPLPDQTRKDGSVEKANAQGVGSAITYLRRYALAAVASVSPADDDGNVASGKKPERGGAASPVRGTVPKEPVAPTPQPLTEKPKALTEEPAPWGAGEKLWPVGDKKGTALKALASADLVAALAWIKKTGRYEDFREPVEEVLASREGE